jgi:hypothetical protein
MTPEERSWLMLIVSAAVLVIGLCALYAAIYCGIEWLRAT